MPVPPVSILILLVFAGAVWVLARALFPNVDLSEIAARVTGRQGVEASEKSGLVDALRPAQTTAKGGMRTRLASGNRRTPPRKLANTSELADKRKELARILTAKNQPTV